MPIVTDSLEHRVQIGVWEGIVTREDIIEGKGELRALADEYGYATYVQIIDTKQLDLLQPRSPMLKQLMNDCERTIAYLVIDGPYFSQVATRLLRRITNCPIENFSTLPEALNRAREIVAASEPASV